MAELYKQGFSEFEIKNSSIKFASDSTAEKVGCVGSLEETMNSKTITKKCEGVVVKSVTRGDGTGELALSLHMRYDLFLKTYGMVLETLKDGVYAYGSNSRHESFIFTAEVLDEDGVKKLKAYPNCIVSSGMARKIENGAEEVAELELTIAVMPDEFGNGVYEALEDGLADEIKTAWMTNFTSSLVQVTKA